MQNGKGSKPRPVNKKIYNQNFDDIRWDYPKKEFKKPEVKIIEQEL